MVRAGEFRPEKIRGEVQCNFDLPQDLNARLESYCDKHHVKKKIVVQLAIVKLLNEVREKQG